jgi:hypothetical protein
MGAIRSGARLVESGTEYLKQSTPNSPQQTPPPLTPGRSIAPFFIPPHVRDL